MFRILVIFIFLFSNAAAEVGSSRAQLAQNLLSDIAVFVLRIALQALVDSIEVQSLGTRINMSVFPLYVLPGFVKNKMNNCQNFIDDCYLRLGMPMVS